MKKKDIPDPKTVGPYSVLVTVSLKNGPVAYLCVDEQWAFMSNDSQELMLASFNEGSHLNKADVEQAEGWVLVTLDGTITVGPQ